MHKLKSDMKQAEKKRVYQQSSDLLNVDQENIIHWKLAKEYLYVLFKTEKNEVMREMESGIDQLYEKFRLEIRSLYLENKDTHGNLQELRLQSHNSLVENIPHADMATNHKARVEKTTTKCVMNGAI